MRSNAVLAQVVVEQHAPVSLVRDRFNKADKMPVTPRNSCGGCACARPWMLASSVLLSAERTSCLHA